MLRILLCLPLLGACSNAASDGAASDNTADKPIKMAGVSPREFKCESIVTVAQIGEALGGSAEFVPGSSTTVGIPAPCSYQVTTPNNGAEYWMWDVDCRATYKKTADALFAQYKETSQELIDAYKAAQDAPKAPPPKRKEGKEPVDAAPERPPEGAVVVDVGAKGLDHHGRGLIFIDDDAPCYVRVIGTDAPRRFELAKLVAKNLTFANAPMSPRPFP